MILNYLKSCLAFLKWLKNSFRSFEIIQESFLIIEINFLYIKTISKFNLYILYHCLNDFKLFKIMFSLFRIAEKLISKLWNHSKILFNHWN